MLKIALIWHLLKNIVIIVVLSLLLLVSQFIKDIKLYQMHASIKKILYNPHFLMDEQTKPHIYYDYVLIQTYLC